MASKKLKQNPPPPPPPTLKERIQQIVDAYEDRERELAIEALKESLEKAEYRD